jgi:signal transduction histidine kinase
MLTTKYLMISTVRKIPLLRYGLIVSLIVILFISAFYLYLYYGKAVNLRQDVRQMVVARESAAKIDSCLIYLYSADNSSRLYLLTSDEKYFNQFKKEITFVDHVITRLNSDNKQVAQSADSKTPRQEKAHLKRESYIQLKSLSDSLLMSAAQIKAAVARKRQQPVSVPVITRTTSHVKIDTLKTIAPVNAVQKDNVEKQKPKKKFFGRVFSVFSSKKDKDGEQAAQQTAAPASVVKRRISTTTKTIVLSPETGKKAFQDYKNILQSGFALSPAEQQLLLVNYQLIGRVVRNLEHYKILEQNYINSGRTGLDNSLQDVVFRFKSLSSLIFVFLISLVVIILYNIWKIFHNEQQLISYSERTEQYAASKSAFLASMSHEIRTPLNSVIGFSEQLSLGELNQVQQEQVKAISSSSKMLLEVVNEILDFSKFETGKMNFDMQPFHLHTALEEACHSLQIQAEQKGISLISVLEVDPAVWLIGDCFRLKQVILNFLSNAVKFTEKGQVTLKARLTAGKNNKKLLQVTVKDSGVGISKEHIPLIFGEFSQVASAQHSASQKGTGLGLAISKKIIELQQGKIWVNSEIGRGSSFSFELLFEETAALEQIHTTQNKDDIYLSLKDKHILVAEDNQLNVLLLTTILKKWGITYDIAEDGVEALSLFEANDYTILLTDIEMPQMNGIELAKLIRMHIDPAKATIPILALTANALKEDKDIYLASGIDGVVLKPFTEKNLIDNITSALHLQNYKSI